MPDARGTLYVVATPIGNLGDVTLRAIETLRAVPLIAAEDTRIARRLLARHEISTRLMSYHAQSGKARLDVLLAHLGGGADLALVTDAGTPAISDPGARLVSAVRAAGFAVVPVPGPSAVTAALSVAGLAAERFAFLGFLPAQAKARRALLASVASLPFAIVVYEAPHRVRATVAELATALHGARTLVVARELTKIFETIARVPLAEASAWIDADVDRQRGEFVLIVDTPAATADAPAALSPDIERWLTALLDELPPARAVRVAAAASGVARDALYARALVLKPPEKGLRLRRLARGRTSSSPRGRAPPPRAGCACASASGRCRASVSTWRRGAP